MGDKYTEACRGTDAVLISSPHNLRYFTGFSGGEGLALIGDKIRYLFVDFRYTIAAGIEAEGFNVIEYGGGKLLETVRGVLDDFNIRTLGFEDLYTNVSDYQKYKSAFDKTELMGLKNKLAEARMIKTEREISYMRRAEEIGDIALSRVLPQIKAGITENEIAAELEYQMRKSGASGTSFSTIAVSGVKTSMPHGVPDDTKVKHGDFVTMDFGCVYNGYCSDMTRTVVVGEASAKQKEIYNIVLKAQLAGLEAIRAGICGKDADRAARSIIEEHGYGKSFGHSLGHGVGLLIHELPNLSPMSEIILKENMVVTCEPGIYIEGFGGVRIEDMVVVKENGVENLSASPKELIVCG